MTIKISSLGLRWKSFRNFFDFVPTDTELASGPFQLGDENAGQVFSKMLSGDQGVPFDLLRLMAERINRQAMIHRGLHGVHDPLGDLALSGVDLGEAPLFDFISKLVALSPVADGERLDRLHRDLVASLSMPPLAGSGDVRFTVEKAKTERSFAPFKEGSKPLVFEAGRDFGQFIIKGTILDQSGPPPLAYVFLRRDPAPLGKRIWEQSFSDSLLWLASPFALNVSHGAAKLFPEPVPVLPEPGNYRAAVVLVRDPETLRTIDPRLDRRKPVRETPPPVRFDEASSIRFLTNVGRAVERREPNIGVAATDYVVAMPAERQAVS